MSGNGESRLAPSRAQLIGGDYASSVDDRTRKHKHGISWMGARRNGRGGRFRDSAASLPDIRALKTKYVGPSFAEGVHEGRYDPDHVEAAVSAALVRRPPGSSTSYAVHVSVHRVPDTSADFTIRVVDSNVLERLGVAEDQATTARSIFDEKPVLTRPAFWRRPSRSTTSPFLGLMIRKWPRWPTMNLAQEGPTSPSPFTTRSVVPSSSLPSHWRTSLPIFGSV